MLPMLVRFSLILSLATAGYPECREGEKARWEGDSEGVAGVGVGRIAIRNYNK